MTEKDRSVGNAASSDNAQAAPASIPQSPGRPPGALDTAAVGRVREVNSARLTGPEMEQAIEAGDAVTVALLLHAGEPANSLMSGRCTPLYRAAEKGYTAVAAVLLVAGGRSYTTEERCITDLMAAAMGGHAPMVDFLVATGADVHAFTLTDESALSFAVRYGHAEAVAALLRAGANPWCDGTVRDHKAHPEINALLETARAARRGEAES